MRAGQGLAFPWVLTPRHPSRWLPDKLEWGGMWPTELHPAQGLLNEIPELSQICLHCGADQCEGLEAIRPNPAALDTPEQPGFPDSDLQNWQPSEVESRGPSLAWLTHSFRGLIHNEALITKASKGFSKKCNFHLGSKVLPKRDTTTTSPFNPFSTSKGKGDERRTALSLWTKSRAVIHCGSPFTALKYPLTCPVSYQSAGEWRSMVGSGDALPQVNRDQGTQRRPRSHLQQETFDLSLQQDFWLWQMATDFQGPGNSFIRPCILHCLLEDTLKTSSQYNLSHNIK